MSSNELKLMGNDCIQQKNYEEAIALYTAALQQNPSDHTLYSNRSLAYYKLEKFDAALHDAKKCNEVAPNFARGYLRKCVALNNLSLYQEASTAAEEGYKLRGSEAICKACVEQWINANQAINQPMIEETVTKIGSFVPEGCVVISEAYLIILLQLVSSRLQNTATGIEIESMVSCILEAFKELDRILQLFGHAPCSSKDDWVAALCLASITDPPTLRVTPSFLEVLLLKSEELVSWFDEAVDHVLYPIVCPIVMLAIMAVGVRNVSLNFRNVDVDVVQVTSRACLPFFRSLLSSNEYHGHQIAFYKELLEAFSQVGYAHTEDDIYVIKESIANVKILMQKCPDSEYTRIICEKAKVSVALAQIRLDETPEFNPFSLDQSAVAVSKALEGNPEELSVFVQKKQAKLQSILGTPKQVLSDSAAEEVWSLLLCISALVKIGKREKAVEVFKLAESVYIQMIEQQVGGQDAAIDTATPVFLTPQTNVLTILIALLSGEDQLVADTIVRWKCIHAEFRAILIQLGVGGRYLQTFQEIQQIQLKNTAESAKKSLLQLAYSHKKELDQILKEKGQEIFRSLLSQSSDQVQKALEPDQIVLEYCLDPGYHSQIKVNEQQSLKVVLVCIQPNGNPIVRPIDFEAVAALSQRWGTLLRPIDKKGRYNAKEAMATAQELCKLLIPSDIQCLISTPKVKRVFVCPDYSISLIALDLLPFEDGKLFIDKCSLVYLSSARELVRRTTISQLRSASIQHQKVTEEGSARDTSPQIYSSQQAVCVTPTADKECLIFADPNYDLQKAAASSIQSDLWEGLIGSFEYLFSEPTDRVDPIPALSESRNEANEIAQILTSSENSLPVRHYMGNEATLTTAMEVQSPFILHFSTHGFSEPDVSGVYEGQFWNDTTSGLALAGFNTYHKGKLDKVAKEAGTGKLTSLAACGMNLQETRVVFLSACVSSYGFPGTGEPTGSLTQAFRAAGVQTVIGTRWEVLDVQATQFAMHFYRALCRTGVSPSQALVYAKNKIRDDYSTFCGNWALWASFVCTGEDIPLFPAK